MSLPRPAAWALLAAFFVQGLFLIVRTSPTTDETAFHMVNGYAYLKTRDYRMSPANPAFLRQWMALPWLALNPRLDLDKDSWRQADSVPFSVDFLYRDNRAIADRLLYSARFMILLLGLLLGWLIYDWSRRLHGEAGGLASLALYAFCPALLSHSAIAHTDIGITCFLFASAYSLWRYLEYGRPRERLIFCALFGLAAASKYHALYFGPIFLVILCVRRGFRETARMAWHMGGISLAIIWASYLFDFRPMLAAGVPRIDEKLAMLPEALRWPALHLPVPAPSYWLGIAGIVRSHQAPYPHYAFGEWTVRSHWYFYFVSFAVKMTLPFLILLAARTAFFRRLPFNAHAAWILLLPAALWFAALCKDSTGVGVRYLFPILPLLLVWAGGLAAVKSRPARLFCGGLLIWNAVACLAVFPNQLSYFNEAAGGVRGGLRLVRGSDVDWGQGLKELKRYLDRNGIPAVTLRYFGTAEPGFYGIRHEPMSDSERKTPENKVYAISLYYLEHAEWTRALPPPVIVGGSIAVYDFRR